MTSPETLQRAGEIANDQFMRLRVRTNRMFGAAVSPNASDMPTTRLKYQIPARIRTRPMPQAVFSRNDMISPFGCQKYLTSHIVKDF